MIEAIVTPSPRARGFRRRVIVSARDVTERRRLLNSNSINLKKMEAVGQLTGGVAHDFNKLLTLVMGGLDIIGRQHAELAPPARSNPNGAGKRYGDCRARRAASLTTRLFTFSRQQALTPQALDANKLVADVANCYAAP